MKTIEFALKNIFSFSTQILIKLYKIINWVLVQIFSGYVIFWKLSDGFYRFSPKNRKFESWVFNILNYFFRWLLIWMPNINLIFHGQWNIHKCIWVCYCYFVGVCLVKLWVATCANNIETSRLLQPKYDIRDWWRREEQWFIIG